MIEININDIKINDTYLLQVRPELIKVITIEKITATCYAYHVKFEERLTWVTKEDFHELFDKSTFPKILEKLQENV
jgi:hypothetical protein